MFGKSDLGEPYAVLPKPRGKHLVTDEVIEMLISAKRPGVQGWMAPYRVRIWMEEQRFSVVLVEQMDVSFPCHAVTTRMANLINTSYLRFHKNPVWMFEKDLFRSWFVTFKSIGGHTLRMWFADPQHNPVDQEEIAKAVGQEIEFA